MSKKAIIELELKADGYKADVAEIQKANTTISDSATKAANQATEAYVQTGKAAKAAFSSTEVQKALVDQNKSVNTLTASLDKLAKEEIELVNANKQATEAYKNNRAEAEKVRSQIAQLTKQTESYNKSNDNTEKKAKSLTGQLRAMKQELALLEQEGKDGTAQFQNLAVAAGKLEDQIGDTRERVRVLSSDTFVFDAAIDATQTLAGAFSAVQGAVGLFAEDNEELQKTIAKTNSALALLNGLQQINAFVTGQSASKLAILNIFQKINDQSVKQSAISYNLLGRSVQFTSVQLNVLKGAFAAIGIGLVIFAITELISAFEKLAEKNKNYERSISGTNEAIKKSGEALKALNDIIKDSETSISVSTGKITQSQADLNNQIDQVKEKSKEAYAPLITEQLNLQKSLKDVNAEIERQNQIIEGNRGSNREGAALALATAQKTLNSELEKRTRIEQELSKIDVERQKISARTVEAIRKVTQVTKAADNSEASKKAAEAAKAAAEKQAKLEEDVAKASREIALKLEQQAAEFTIKIRTKGELDWQKEAERLAELKKKRDEARALSFEAINENFFDGQINRLKRLELEEGSTSARRIQLIEAEGQKRIAEIRLNVDDIANANNQILLVEAETQAAIRAERKRTTEESIKQITEYVDAFGNLLSSLNDLSRQQTENRINDLTAQQQKEIDNINTTFQTETQKQRQREAAEFRFQRQIAAEKQKQAIQDKKLALLSATVNTAKAIVAALPNIPLSILVGIAGAAQIAAIASQPIPKFEKGGEVRGKRHRDGGTLIEAEEGEYIINRNQTRRHGEEISALNRSTAEFHRLLERKYIQPRIASILSGTNRRSDKVVVNATLNARTMEGELKGLRKDIRRSATKGYKSNQTDTRYQWQRN
jgi:hypothetical protein